MRILTALFAALAAAMLAAAPATAARDWSATVVQAPDGGYVVGNPAARVKLVEYMSYTCPHCAAFSAESEPVLGHMIASGSVSLERHNLVRDRLDLAAAILARCGGGAKFVPLTRAIFAKQQDWLPSGMDYVSDNDQRLALYPEAKRLEAYADGAGLTAIARANGLTDQQIATCYADPAQLGAVLGLASHPAAGVTGTPMFTLNGKLVDGAYDWTRLQPVLIAAGAK